MRDEVQRWLSACIVAGYDTPDGDNSHVRFEVDAPTLEALCRRWLAVEDAPTAVMDTREFLSLCAPTEEDFPALYALQGQRVRLVPEAGQGVGK